MDKKNKVKFCKNTRGFTLLEMIVAIFIVTVALIGIMSLIHRSIVSAQISYSKLTAAYLAQEGLEIIRNIRDSNWLAQSQNPNIPWDQNLNIGEWEVSYTDFTLTPYQGRNLKIDGGFYNYTRGIETKFKRKITLHKPQPNIIAVSVEVTWQERGIPYSVSIKENIYNWWR